MPWGHNEHGDGVLAAYNGPRGSGRCHWQCVMGCFAFAAPAPRQEQVKVLWNMIQLYYKDARVPDRLDSLTDEIIKHDKKPPRQKGRAAQVRYSLPFATKGWPPSSLCRFVHSFPCLDSMLPILGT